jgi:transposase
VVVASVPWARHDAGHTRAFDEQVAWLATKTSKTAVTELMRVAWRTVGSIIERVWNDTEGLFDRFADLTRIGIDEISRAYAGDPLPLQGEVECRDRFDPWRLIQ